MILGNLEDFISTSCVTNLSFLSNNEEGEPDQLNPCVQSLLEQELNKSFFVRKVCYLTLKNNFNLLLPSCLGKHQLLTSASLVLDPENREYLELSRELVLFK